jgi:coenzyme PQQ precursor peptide PqqA
MQAFAIATASAAALSISYSCAARHVTLQYGRLTKIEGCEMAWTTPTLVEICIGLEINGYLPAEF